MAEQDAQERTEQATPKRQEDARRKGQIPRSRDLSAAAVTLAGALALYASGHHLTGGLHALMRRSFTPDRSQLLDEAYALDWFGEAALAALWLCAPALGVMALAAVLAPMLLGGWNFSTEALAPKFDRLDPFKGIARMFSARALVELAKALAKFAVVAVIAVAVLRHQAADLLALGNQPLVPAMAQTLRLCAQALVAMTAGLLLIAAIDVPFQLWQHARQLKMSRQEVRQEHKESEGSPEVKGRIRQLQQSLARQRMMQEVPKADVVITNPTHFAVALRYDQERMRAPVVVAKGVELVAARIRELAQEHGVTLVEAPPLARVLYRQVELNEAIPPALYVAVAQVLTYVFQLRQAQRAGERAPPPPDVDVTE